MNPKWIYALFGIVLLSGVVFAISGATVTEVVERGRWLGNTPTTNITTEGGNITGVTVNATVLTDRWASFYGNVTGSIVLTDNVSSNNVYSWDWVPENGGEVCVVANATDFAWASADVTTGAEIDTVWGFTGVSDSATITFASSNCTLNFAEATVTNTANVTLLGNSSFTTCAIEDQGTPAVKQDFAFCTVINSTGSNYNGETASFEVMVPTAFDTPSATETYYFFAELN